MASSGPLVPSDELLVHQVAQTFARVGSSDRSWTEKVWAMAATADGSLSVAFGLGKYPNRNVMDAFGGVSRGTEQWTVRASRRLAPTAADQRKRRKGQCSRQEHAPVDGVSHGRLHSGS